MHKKLIITLSLLLFTYPSNNAKLPQLNNKFTRAIVNPKIRNIMLYNKATQVLEKQNKTFIKITASKTLNFLKEKTAIVTNKQIHFFHTPLANHNAFAFGGNNVVISSEDFYKLINIITNDPEFKQQENVLFLNKLTFILQHEAGHIQNKHIQKKILSSFILAPAGQSTISQIYIGRYQSHKQEFAADNSVIDEDAIKAGIEFLQEIKTIENNSKLKRLIKLRLTHPSPENRCKQLKRKLDIKEKSTLA